jgi:hypothetical protein
LFGERGINPLAKPRFLLAPAQAFRPQQLADARALHRNPLDLLELRLQPVQRPTSEW